jgi:hypothetical protein
MTEPLEARIKELQTLLWCDEHGTIEARIKELEQHLSAVQSNYRRVKADALALIYSAERIEQLEANQRAPDCVWKLNKEQDWQVSGGYVPTCTGRSRWGIDSEFCPNCGGKVVEPQQEQQGDED